MAKKKHSPWLSSIAALVAAAFRLARFLVVLAYRLAVGAVEGVLWILLGVKSLVGFGVQVGKSAKAAATGVLRCPDGHAILIGRGDTVHACTACGFRYRGSPLACPNPECEAPIAAYVSCPTCGLSVSSPFRGHG